MGIRSPSGRPSAAATPALVVPIAATGGSVDSSRADAGSQALGSTKNPLRCSSRKFMPESLGTREFGAGRSVIPLGSAEGGDPQHPVVVPAVVGAGRRERDLAAADRRVGQPVVAVGRV